MKRHSDAVARNSAPIAEVLARELPAHGTVLEVASGTGEHAVFFARRFPQLRWQPSDLDAELLTSVAAWREDAGLPNLQPPVLLDAGASPWPVERADAVLCINMVHISPWRATKGLFREAARVLPAGGPLILYGPYLEEGEPTAPSNAAFNASLRARDPAWGLRQVGALDLLAARVGLERASRHVMPANNLMLVYRSTTR